MKLHIKANYGAYRTYLGDKLWEAAPNGSMIVTIVVFLMLEAYCNGSVWKRILVL